MLETPLMDILSQRLAGRLAHLGMSEAPKRSTLSYANAHRTWELYERLFYDLLQTCKTVAPRKKFRFRNKLKSIDSSVIELCIEMFDWAKYRKAKGAAKLHLVLDHDGYLPVFADLTDGREEAVFQMKPYPADPVHPAETIKTSIY